MLTIHLRSTGRVLRATKRASIGRRAMSGTIRGLGLTITRLRGGGSSRRRRIGAGCVSKACRIDMPYGPSRSRSFARCRLSVGIAVQGSGVMSVASISKSKSTTGSDCVGGTTGKASDGGNIISRVVAGKVSRRVSAMSETAYSSGTVVSKYGGTLRVTLEPRRARTR